MGAASDDVSGEGAARELLSALHNVHVLLSSPKVGPKVIEPLLSEIRRRVTVLARGSILAVTPFGADVIPGAIASWEARLVVALDAARLKHVDARTRLALEAAVAETAPRIDALREAIDLRGRAGAPRLELRLGSLVEQALTTPSSTRPFGVAVKVRGLPPEEAHFAVLAAPYPTLLLLAFAASFANQAHPDPDHAVLSLRARLDGDLVRLTAEVGPSGDPSAPRSFMVPRATDEARALLLAPGGPLEACPGGGVGFSLPHGLTDSASGVLR